MKGKDQGNERMAIPELPDALASHVQARGFYGFRGFRI